MAKLIDIVSDHSDPTSASLSVVEFSQLPWEPRRVYWLTNFNEGSSRGNHAHRNLSQIFIAMTGTIEIEIFHGIQKKTYFLTENQSALHLSPGAWRVITNPSPDALVMVLANLPYDEADYIRDWDEYLVWYQSEYLSG